MPSGLSREPSIDRRKTFFHSYFFIVYNFHRLSLPIRFDAQFIKIAIIHFVIEYFSI